MVVLQSENSPSTLRSPPSKISMFDTKMPCRQHIVCSPQKFPMFRDFRGKKNLGSTKSYHNWKMKSRASVLRQLIPSLQIQSPCQRVIGLYNHLLSTVFRFHYHCQNVIGSLGHEQNAFFPQTKSFKGSINDGLAQKTNPSLRSRRIYIYICRSQQKIAMAQSN